MSICTKKYGANMKPHGDYEIELIDDVVHVFPVGGFNGEGVKQLHKEIASAAPLNKPWALMEHPKSIAGLTPDGVEELIKAYQNLCDLNCVIACLEVSRTWQGVFERSIIDKVKIPVYLDSDVTKLDRLITQKLATV